MTKSKAITTTAAALLLATAGYTAIPEVVQYDNIKFDRQLQQDLGSKSWNMESVATEGSLTRRESWLLPDKIIDATPTRFVSKFNEGWRNYLGADGKWYLINTDFVPTTGGWKVTDIPFEVFVPEFSDEIAVFHNNNRFDSFEKKEITAPPLDMTIQALGITRVQGRLVKGDLIGRYGYRKNVSYVIYDNVLPDTDLIYEVHFGAAPRLEKLIRRRVKTALDFSFKITHSRPVDLSRLNDGALKIISQTDSRGIGMKDFRIWDSDIFETTGKHDTQPTQQTIDVTISTTTGGYILTKHLPALPTSWVLPIWSDIVSVFNPNADPESTSVDGAVRNTSCADTWVNCRHAADGTSATPTGNQFIGTGKAAGGQFHLQRGFLLFDTSSLDDTFTVNDVASTSVMVQIGSPSNGDNDGNDFQVVTQTTPASDTNLVVGDYDQVTGLTGAMTEASDRIDITGWVDATLKLHDLNVTGVGAVSLTGITKFGLAEGHDVLNDEYNGTTANNEWVIVFAENTPKPELSVDNSAAAAVGDNIEVIIISRFDYLRSALINTTKAFFNGGDN